MKRFYPAVLEQGPKKSFAVWFPDFPDCVAAGTSQEQALERAEEALARAADTAAERDGSLPAPTPFDRIAVPKGCKPIAFLAVGVEPPDPSERVNIYLPKSLIGRADRRAADLGMSRSSYFGLALSLILDGPPNAQSLGNAPFEKLLRGERIARLMNLQRKGGK